jgi:hypothetical protein
MRSYELLRGRTAVLDVDKRWMKYPGPGQRNLGDTREKLFTLGLAYGLIAQQGDFYYSNFHPSLIRVDRTQEAEKEQLEADPEKVYQALKESRSPADWFKSLTLGPSAAPTIPAQFGTGLGAGKKRDSRDCIGQGRQAAMAAFRDDAGEDYSDVADAITMILTAYAQERGRSAAREELAWYAERLREGRANSSQLKEQYERELSLLEEMAETVGAQGDFGLPEPSL